MTPPQTPHRTAVAPVLLLWGAGLGAAAQYGKISVIFDMLPQLYPAAGPALGFMVSLVGFVGILLGVVAGLVVARISYRRALLWALWTGAAISLLQALQPPLWLMLASRVAEGASHLAMVVAAPTLIAQISAPRHRGFTLTLWGTFFGVAFAVLAFAGRPLAQSYGVPALFLAHALYLAVFAMLLSARLRRLPQEGPPPSLSPGEILRQHLEIYRSPRLVAPAAGWLFYTFSFVSVLTVLPPHVDPAYRTAVMGAMPLAGIAVSMTLGVALLKRMTAVRVIELGFALSALCMAWLWAWPGHPAAAIALAAAMGLVQGASFAAVPQLNEKAQAQARANGAMAQMGNLGNTMGTPIMAAAVAGVGFAGLPLLAGGAFLAGLGAHVLLGRLRGP